jgi:ATP-dependent Lhr-like helicase
MTDGLPASFHPLIRAWFTERYGLPTPVQAAAWPRIAAGEHVLAAAPTGSGKTLTAFLDAMARFVAGDLDPGCLSVLYISPLKALNEDIRLNLTIPLHELSTAFGRAGQAFPRIRVASRSGDTPQSERRRTLKDPPSILCTTPESLAILLASRQGLALLSSVRLVILDEVHAVLTNKRGSLLACCLGRLALLAGEFQRVALSATVKPFVTAAAFVGGRRLLHAADGSVGYEDRPVAIVAPPAVKSYELQVAWPVVPLSAGNDADGDIPTGRYVAITDDLAARLGSGRPTIVFTDSRRRAERLAALINEHAGDGSAWTHHGSLSRDVRRAVESRLRAGTLPCVVATGTLELGIDIGSVDLVAFAGAPARADQALQRVGRSGHAVGRTSRGLCYPFHGMDLLQAAAAVGAVQDGDVDVALLPSCPLDILAQTILSMVLFSERPLDQLFDEIRSFQPFLDLPRDDFDAVVAMLAGRWQATRIKELQPRVYLDSEKHSIKAREGSTMLLYAAGGSIPDRGYYAMRLAGSGERIGELDEEFVFERRVGNSFAFGSQAWRIVAIGDEAVDVAPLDRDADFMPFWKADKPPRGASLALRMLDFCAAWEAQPNGFVRELVGRYGFSEAAAAALDSFLARQRRAQGAGRLPSRTSLAMEVYRDPDARAGSTAVLLHTLRGRAINEPLGLVLAASLTEITGLTVDRLCDDDSVLLLLPLASPSEAATAVDQALAALGQPASLSAWLRHGLENSSAFGAAFRENAGRALLLPRHGFGKRTPLWMTRLRAKRLFAKVATSGDFPIIKESWRSVLEQRFDLPGLYGLCSGLTDGSIALIRFSSTIPSPFARQAGWATTNHFLYAGDEMGQHPTGAAGRITAGGPAKSSASSTASSHVRGSVDPWDSVINAAMDQARLRPPIPLALAADFTARLRREAAGWTPESAEALADWLDERVLIPMDEWMILLAACPAPLADVARQAAAHPGSGPGILARLAVFEPPSVAGRVGLASICRRERLPTLRQDAGALAAEWLRSNGPIPLGRLAAVFGLDDEAVQTLCEDWQAAGSVIVDAHGFGLTDAVTEPWVCDRDVLEALLRTVRRAARPTLAARPTSQLASFLAKLQGLAGSSVPEVLRILSGYPAPRELWETEILPARVANYQPADLDAVLASGEFLWFGAGSTMLAFCPSDEWELFCDAGSSRGSSHTSSHTSSGTSSGTSSRMSSCTSRCSALVDPADPPRDAWAIKSANQLELADLAPAIWAEAARGLISADSFEPVRRLIAQGPSPGIRMDQQSAGLSEAMEASPTDRRGSHQPRIPLALRDRWKAGPPVAGRWFALAIEPVSLDEVDALDMAADRVRILLRRYGLLSRSILERELPALRWTALFPALRRMELAGELVCGKFITSLDGPQFMGQAAFAAFRDGASDQGNWSMNACDPASPAGLVMTPAAPFAAASSAAVGTPASPVAVDKSGSPAGLVMTPAAPFAAASPAAVGTPASPVAVDKSGSPAGLVMTPAAPFAAASPAAVVDTPGGLVAVDTPGGLAGLVMPGLDLPPRVRTTHLAFHAGHLAIITTASYRDLRIGLSADDPDLPALLAFFRRARDRAVQPARRIIVRTINGQRAAYTDYAQVLIDLGFEADRGTLTLW